MFNRTKRVVKAHANAALKKLEKSQTMMEARLPELKQEAVDLYVKAQELRDARKSTTSSTMQARFEALAADLEKQAKARKEQYRAYEAKLQELEGLRLILKTRRDLTLKVGTAGVDIDEEIAAIERELAALDNLGE